SRSIGSKRSNSDVIAPAFVSRPRNSQIVLASGTRSESPRPRKRMKEPVVDQVFGALVRQRVDRLDHQDFEHHHWIQRRTSAFAAVAVGKRGLQFWAKHLEINGTRERFELVAKPAQPCKSLIDVKKARLIHIQSPQ